MNRDPATARDVLNAEAAAWVVRLASETCTAADRQAFEAWRARGPAHELAFERESLVWEKADALAVLRSSATAGDLADLAGNLTADSDSGPRRWPLFAAAASLLVAAGLGLVLWLQSVPVDYVTAIGERRVIHLEDGSRLELNTNTRARVRFDDDSRRVELQHGEALFDVMPDAGRPFSVVMGDNTVQAVGTAFSIRRDADTYRVLVTEGVVEASGRAIGDVPAYRLRLAAGSAGIYAAGSLTSETLSPEALERALSWRTGTIALAGETLAEAVQEFNRYNTRQLVVVDPSITALQLGGYFDAHDVDGFVRVLEAAFAIVGEAQGQRVLLHGAPRAEQSPESGQDGTSEGTVRP